MNFDPENPIIKLCGQGMLLEGDDNVSAAAELFMQAWNEASNDFEKFTAAHYVARHQNTVADKLRWDEVSLNLALNINDDGIKGAYPSLYLNVAKCHEDLKDFDKENENYQLALLYTGFLNDDGYGNMIRAGINNGI